MPAMFQFIKIKQDTTIIRRVWKWNMLQTVVTSDLNEIRNKHFSLVKNLN